MNEVAGENIKDTRFSRREVFKFGAGLATGVVVSAITHTEIERAKQGVITEVGVFIPLYERHDIGIKPENISQNLDVFFREITYGSKLMSIETREILMDEAIGYDNPQRKPVKTFPREILSKLAQQGTEVMIGDVDISLNEEFDRPIILGEYVPAGIIIEAFLFKKFKDCLSCARGNKGQKEGVARRKMLKTAIAGSYLWAFSPAFSKGTNYFGQAREGALKRVAARLSGIQSHAHPEILNEFFRNLVMADKLSTVGGGNKTKNRQNPTNCFPGSRRTQWD